MAKSKKITGAGIVSAPISPETPITGKVWIILMSDNKEHLVSSQLAKTLINKQFAKLK
jgi:hypothetical protein